MCAVASARPTPAYLKAVEDLRENPDQWQAFSSTGNCVVLAGPGSGKTKTLTVKMARMLIEDVRPPRGLACLTYSTECVRELQRRLDSLGIGGSRNAFIGTIHSFCLQQIVLPFARLGGLRLPNPLRIALSSEQGRAFEDAVSHVLGPSARPSAWRTEMERHRRSVIDRESDEWHNEQYLPELVVDYERRLHARGMIDFEDMVLMGLRLIETHSWVRKALRSRFPILVVDEYQDLGVALHLMVESLCVHSRVRLFAVGDPDQSIYGFTGAQPDLLRTLAARRGVESVSLKMNYRSGATIVRASEIALGQERGYRSHGVNAGTVDFYRRPDGLADQAKFICEELIPEALSRVAGLALGDVAVLYRDKNDGDVIGAAAAAAGLPHLRLDKGAPYPKTPLTRFIEDCARWSAGGWKTATPRLANLTRAFAAITKAVSDEARDKTRRSLVGFLLSNRGPHNPFPVWLEAFTAGCLQRALEEAGARDEIGALATLRAAAERNDGSSWTVASFSGQGGSPDHLNLITLHSAKGLEFRVAVLMGMEQGTLPHWSARTPVKKAEERRLFYVGVTRAKDEVHLTYSGWTVSPTGQPFNNGPSEFLTDLRNRLQTE